MVHACMHAMPHAFSICSHNIAMAQVGVLGNPRETLKLGVPSALYTLQANLFYASFDNLAAATFQVP